MEAVTLMTMQTVNLCVRKMNDKYDQFNEQEIESPTKIAKGSIQLGTPPTTRNT
jgi:hypothetical protein